MSLVNMSQLPTVNERRSFEVFHISLDFAHSFNHKMVLAGWDGQMVIGNASPACLKWVTMV